MIKNIHSTFDCKSTWMITLSNNEKMELGKAGYLNMSSFKTKERTPSANNQATWSKAPEQLNRPYSEIVF